MKPDVHRMRRRTYRLEFDRAFRLELTKLDLQRIVECCMPALTSHLLRYDTRICANLCEAMLSDSSKHV